MRSAPRYTAGAPVKAPGHPAGKLTALSFLALTLERALALVLVAIVAAVFGAGRQSSTYFLALIVPMTLGVSMSEAFYTALLPHFTRPSRPPRGLLLGALRVAAPLTLAATAVYAGVVAAVEPRQVSVWLALSPILFAAALNGVFAAFLTADRRYPLASLRVPMATAVALVFVAAVLPGWRSTTALALGISIGQLVTLAVLAFRVRGAPAGETRRFSAGEMLGPSAAVFAASLVGGPLVVVVERFLASGLVAGAVALLVFARGVALLPVMVAQALGSGIFPAATERFKTLERESLARLAVTAVRLSMLAALVSTAFVVVCRHELVRVAFQRHKFGTADARETATLVAIMAASLAGVSLAATASKALFALGRRTLVLGISAGGVALYVVAAVALRDAFGLDGLATAFTVASAIGGLGFAVALVIALRTSAGDVVREWIAAPVLLAAAAAAAAFLVRFGLGASESLGRAIATIVAAGLAALLALLVAMRVSRSLEYSLITRRSLMGRRWRRGAGGHSMSNTGPESTVPSAASGGPEAGSAGREGRRPGAT